MARAALDASALLALIRGERGGDAVRAAIPGGVASAVNWSEVGKRLLEEHQRPGVHRQNLAASGMAIVPFDVEDAELTALLREPTRPFGLSLADRACLALALRLGVPAYTADRRWADLDIGVEIIVIR